MKITGEQLRKMVRNQGIKVADLSVKSGIPEQTIYGIYKKAVVEDHYLKKFELGGLIIEGFNNNSEVLDKNNINVLKATLFMMERQNKIMEARIEELKLHNQDLRKNNETLNTVVLSKIVGEKK